MHKQKYNEAPMRSVHIHLSFTLIPLVFIETRCGFQQLTVAQLIHGRFEVSNTLTLNNLLLPLLPCVGSPCGKPYDLQPNLGRS